MEDYTTDISFLSLAFGGLESRLPFLHENGIIISWCFTLSDVRRAKYIKFQMHMHQMNQFIFLGTNVLKDIELTFGFEIRLSDYVSFVFCDTFTSNSATDAML